MSPREATNRPATNRPATATNKAKFRPDRDAIGRVPSIGPIGALQQRDDWRFEWQAAKTLALLPLSARRVEVIRNWDYLSQRGDITLILATAEMIREVARHGDLDRATARLIDKVERR